LMTALAGCGGSPVHNERDFYANNTSSRLACRPPCNSTKRSAGNGFSLRHRFACGGGRNDMDCPPAKGRKLCSLPAFLVGGPDLCHISDDLHRDGDYVLD